MAEETRRDVERPRRARAGVSLVPLAHHALMSAFYAAIAVAGLVIGSLFGEVHAVRVEPRVVLWTAAAVFVVAGIATTHRLSRWLGDALGASSLPSSGRALRLVVSIAGYVIVLFATLGLVSVPIDHLLVGGAVTGVVLGIAAQQVLGNVFAGAVLLAARPFAVGDHIRVRSGALGGQFDGVVKGMNLTYVTIRTEEGTLNVPNSGMLAAAVGPWKKALVAPAPEPGPAVAAGTPTPTGNDTTTPR
jgi:small-conductance mechanosensitive channel